DSASTVATTEASRKPSTNFGNRDQITASVLRSPKRRPCSAGAEDATRREQYRLSSTATTPSSAFWVTLTIEAICSGCSPATAPAAVTAAVVSMLPPIQAPVTAGDRPIRFASHGSRKIEGTAK